MQALADRLRDIRLCLLFVETQFAAMSADWCQQAWGMPRPPATVVFGRGSWERYQEQIRGDTVFVINRR